LSSKVDEARLKIQRKMNRLVSTIKKIEIPSIPRRRANEKEGRISK